MEKAKLNIDLGESISAFRYFLKRFDILKKNYKIFFRGKSFDFDGFRDYTGDEDVSSIDWKASNKSGKLLVRQYKEEEDKKIVLVIDVGENMVSGSAEKIKCEYAAELALSLGDIIINSNDRLGFILFSDKVNEYYIPKRGTRQIDILLDLLSNPKTYKNESDISKAFEFILTNFASLGYTIVLISDFLNFSKKNKRDLAFLSSKYETMAFIVKDLIDKTLPDIDGEFVIESTTGEQLLIEPKLAKRQYEKHALKQENFVKESLKDASVDFLELSTEKSFIFDVIEFLKERTKRKVLNR